MGEGWGEGILQIAAIFPNTLTAQIQALRLVALSLTLSHGREDGVAVGIKASQGKQVVQAAFCFSDDLKSTVVNPSCLSNRLQPQNLLQPAPSPRGGGLGRGHSPNCGNLSQHLNLPNTSLAARCPLSSSLPRGERTGRLLGLRVLRENRLYWLLFIFQAAYINGRKPKWPFKPPETAKPAATRSLPRGGGLGRGHFSNGGNLSQHSNRPKYKPCGLLPSL